MDNAGTVGGGDEIAEHGIMAALVGLDEIIDRLIFQSGQFRTGAGFKDVVCALQHLEAGLGQNQEVPQVRHLDVFDLGVQREGDIGKQGPGRGRPDEEIGILFPLNPGADIDRGVAHLFVPL